MYGYIRDDLQQLAEAERMGRNRDKQMRDWDWLAVAIGKLGGPARAATRLGVSRQTVYTWLDKGLGRVEFEKIVKLHEESDVPLEYLRRRTGPFKGQFKLPSEVNGNV